VQESTRALYGFASGVARCFNMSSGKIGVGAERRAVKY
jgi:hypothetical protein